nr:hypothetical protein [uncultured Desulfobulbus sp.]
MNFLKTIATKTKNFFQKAKAVVVPAALAICGIGASVALGPQASHAGVAELFAAADISGLATLIEALLTTFVGIMLLFIGYKYLKRAGNRG